MKRKIECARSERLATTPQLSSEESFILSASQLRNFALPVTNMLLCLVEPKHAVLLPSRALNAAVLLYLVLKTDNSIMFGNIFYCCRLLSLCMVSGGRDPV